MEPNVTNQKPVTNVNTANATVTPIELENIKGEKMYYCRVDTIKGRINISVGEKNFKALAEILTK